MIFDIGVGIGFLVEEVSVMLMYILGIFVIENIVVMEIDEFIIYVFFFFYFNIMEKCYFKFFKK